MIDEHEGTSDLNKKKSKGAIVWTIVKWFLLTVKWIIIVSLITGIFAGTTVAGFVATFVKDEPVRSRIEIESKVNNDSITGFVYFNDQKTLVGQLRTDEDRQLVTIDEIPDTVINALLAVEDNNFYKHNGIDFVALARAVKQQVLNEDVQTGGSTLTQQLVRRVFLDLDRTKSRKIKEIFLSLRIERVLTKDQILTAYLNKMPFGTGANGYNLYGIKSAARGIFNILDLKKINNAQAAYLAGLPQRPSAYTAFTRQGTFNEENYKLAKERQELVLKRMLETGRITEAEYQEALQFDIRKSFAKPSPKAYATYPYLMIEAERQAAEVLLMQENPELTLEDVRKDENADALEAARQRLLRGGYKVYTTIDKQIYAIMRNIANNPRNFSPDSKVAGMEQIAGMMINHKTGAILGMLEGRSFEVEQLNFATQMTRQPGSTMKTIAAYLPAIEKGLVQPATILDDAPMVLTNGTGGYHIPKNANNYYSGLVTAREALNRSLNLPALKVFNQLVTIPESWKFVKTLGITTLQPADDHAQTGVLGGLSVGVTVEELTNAYGSIANKGVFNDAYLIESIRDSEGNIVYQHQPNPVRVFSEQSAYLVTDMLRTVIADERGTAHSMVTDYKNYGKIPIVGKTGTTQSYGDVWFQGFTPDITLGVWAGHEKQIYPLSEASGGRKRARTIWAEIMNEVTKKRPDLFPTRKFVAPSNIFNATVSSVSGNKPSALNKELGLVVTDIFNKEFLPKEEDTSLVKGNYIAVDGINYLPNPLTPVDFLKEQVAVIRKQPLDVLMDQINAILPKLSTESRKPLAYYLPKDAALDAPSKIDPRVDNGKIPAAPTAVTITKANSKTLNVTFVRPNDNDLVGHRLYVSINDGPVTKVGPSLRLEEEPKFTFTIAPNNNYKFYVTAVDLAGNESVMTKSVNYPTVFVPTTVPSAPTNVTFTTTSTDFQLSWTANAGSEQVTMYRIYTSATDPGTYTLVNTSTTASYSLPLTAAGFYRISAVNAKGESATSTTIHVQ